MYVYFLNVNINVSINDYLFKYVYLVCYLKFSFYWLTCSAISNLNSADLKTNTKQSSEIFILKIEMLLEFQNKTNIEIIEFQLMILDWPWIRQIQICEIQICWIHTRLDLLDVNPHFFVAKAAWKCLQDMTSGRLQDISSKRLQEMPSRRLPDISSRCLEDVFIATIFRLPRRLGRRKLVTLKMC